MEKIEEIKKIQVKNINAVLAQGEKLEVLKDKAEDLESAARLFSKTAHQVEVQASHRKKTVQFFLLAIVFLGVFIAYTSGSAVAIILSILLGGGIIWGTYWKADSSEINRFQDKFDKSFNTNHTVNNFGVSNPSVHPAFHDFKSKQNIEGATLLTKNTISHGFKK